MEIAKTWIIKPISFRHYNVKQSDGQHKASAFPLYSKATQKFIIQGID